MAQEGIKKEFRIDSSDAARPQVTIHDEPRYFSDIKPKKRVLSDVIYEPTGEVSQTRVGKPVEIILKTSIYDDGVLVQTTVGSDNEGYREFKRTGVAIPNKSGEDTAVHKKSDAVAAAVEKAKKAAAKSAPKAAAKAKE
jgi:hypothetical protein